MKFTQPRRIPEANIQAHFYMRCVQEGIKCILEYKVPGSRFDAVIHDEKEIIFIVEVKSMSQRARYKRINGNKVYKQIERYEKHGVPVIEILNYQDVDAAIFLIKRDLRI